MAESCKAIRRSVSACRSISLPQKVVKSALYKNLLKGKQPAVTPAPFLSAIYPPGFNGNLPSEALRPRKLLAQMVSVRTL